MTGAGLVNGPGGWQLAPEGAAVHPRARAAVIADVHLGYEWARGTRGDCVPAHSLAETIARLDALFHRVAVDRLIVAGDLVESRAFCRRTERDLDALRRWLTERGVDLLALAGNHDPPQSPPWPATCAVAGWTIGHGHESLDAPRTITGHYHPALRASGVNAPCFLVAASALVLPAFSQNAAGVGLATLPPRFRHGGFSCVASTGGELLDFGPVDRLLGALHAGTGA